MADETAAERKSQLINELERSRLGVAQGWRGARKGASLTGGLKWAVERRKLAWLTGAAIGGLVLTRLLFRKKKAVREVAAMHQVHAGINQSQRAGILLSILGLLVTLFRPAVTNYLSRKIADYTSGDGHIPAPRRPMWH